MQRHVTRQAAVVSAVGLSAVAVLGLAWTTLRAQGPIIQACAATRDGTLRLAIGGCDTRRETPVEWNQQGPVGPPGPAGGLATVALPVGPVFNDRRAAGCETGSDAVVRISTITLEPGDYRVTPLVSEALQVTGSTGQARTQMDFDHATTGARVAISYWRIYDRGQGQILALNSSSFRLSEATPVRVTMTSEVRGCGFADMAGAVYFDRVTVQAAPVGD